jgi:hypothetical protein
MPWVPISYRDFYDVPRAFVVSYKGRVLFFDCPFDEGVDDYPEGYEVYRLSKEGERIAQSSSWERLASYGRRLGSLPVSEVRFDRTRRAAIDDQALRAFT